MAEEYAARGDLKIEVKVEIAVKLSAEEERVVYRLVQEALNNVVKHAAAGSARVSARLVGDRVQIAVEDDGRGFDQDSVPAGRGLIGMRERVEMLGGEIGVDSEPDGGTRVSATVPVQLS
jgi:signal transduction histidine kinase